jgi:aminoglycoside N3'-acetyltransferase
VAVALQDIREAVRALGLGGRPVCVHASLRSFGRVDGGAQAVVAGLLGEGCTVLVPTFTWNFIVPPLPHQRRQRNGGDFEAPARLLLAHDRVFTPDSNEIDLAGMGAVPAAVLACADRVRGNHPLCSFAAVGPLANDLVQGQAPLDKFAPLRRLAELDGAVVLMGVDLTSMTLLHLAEQMAGRQPFRRWANGPDGSPIEVETGGCSDGFEQLTPHLATTERRRTVGSSSWRVYAAHETLRTATQVIQAHPMLTVCNARCRRCEDGLLGGPILDR